MVWTRKFLYSDSILAVTFLGCSCGELAPFLFLPLVRYFVNFSSQLGCDICFLWSLPLHPLASNLHCNFQLPPRETLLNPSLRLDPSKGVAFFFGIRINITSDICIYFLLSILDGKLLNDSTGAEHVLIIISLIHHAQLYFVHRRCSAYIWLKE